MSVIKIDTALELKDNFSGNVAVGTILETLGYYTIGDGGAATYIVKSVAQLIADGDVIDGYGNHALPNNTIAVLVTDGVVNVKQFGAVGGGVTDDTDAFLGALTHIGEEGVLYIPRGTYNISSTLNLDNTNHITILSVGGVLKWIGAEGDYLVQADDSAGSLIVDGLTVDGNASLNRAFSLYCNSSITACTIYNLFADEGYNSAVGVSFSPITHRTLSVTHCTIRDFNGYTGGSTGQGQGTTRAIYCGQSEGNLGCTITIANNHFDNFFGREGDILQLDDYRVDKDTHPTHVSIHDNYFGASNRRSIKCRFSNVTITSNTFVTMKLDNPNYALDGQGGAGVISGGGISSTSKNLTIQGNTIYNWGGVKRSVYIGHDNTVVLGNSFIAMVSGDLASALNLQLGDGITITGNYIDQTSEIGVSDRVAVSNVLISSNSIKVGGRAVLGISPNDDSGSITIRSNDILATGNGWTGVVHQTVLGSESMNTSVVNNTVRFNSAVPYKVLYSGGDGGITQGLRMVGNTLESSPTDYIRRLDSHDFSGCVIEDNSTEVSSGLGWEIQFNSTLLVNGYFKTGTTGWSLSGGVYDADAQAVWFTGLISLKQTVVEAFEVGKFYKVTFHALDMAQPFYRLLVGGVEILDYKQSSTRNSLAGEHSVVFKMPSDISDNKLWFLYASSGTPNMLVSSISMHKQV